MKKIFAGLLVVTFAAATVPTAPAGDREWATAGKILTGLVAAQVVCQALNPAPVYVAPPPVYVALAPAVVAAPAPAPVYYATPAPVYYAPPPPVYAAPAPVYYAPAPVYYARPVVSFRVGIGFGPRWHHPYRRW